RAGVVGHRRRDDAARGARGRVAADAGGAVARPARRRRHRADAGHPDVLRDDVDAHPQQRCRERAAMKLSPAQRLNPAAWIILPLMRAWMRRTNPTRDFPAARVSCTVVSVDAAAAGSLHPTMPLRALESLGPADWHVGPAGFRRLFYYPLGT